MKNDIRESKLITAATMLFVAAAAMLVVLAAMLIVSLSGSRRGSGLPGAYASVKKL